MLKKHLKPIHIITAQLTVLLLLLLSLANQYYPALSQSIDSTADLGSDHTTEETEDDYIKWVDFGVTYEAMDKTYQYDVDTYGQEVHLDWIELLACLGAKYGGDFSLYQEKDLTALAKALISQEETIESLTEDMHYYSYYLEAYTAVLGGLVGSYEIQIDDENNPGELVWVEKYGLKGFSPIAKGFEYQHYEDFGTSRSYGYKRLHLGHDMMGQVGTPIIAVESGYVEAMGWNQYGGWRLGIRSFDGKRYYYYAHLRKNFPYHTELETGSIVSAGDVIGFMGRTGYSTTENTNNIEVSHLHFGLQLIFDESQKEGTNEIWIDCYELTKFLSKNKSATLKHEETKNYYRVYGLIDPAVADYLQSQ